MQSEMREKNDTVQFVTSEVSVSTSLLGHSCSSTHAANKSFQSVQHYIFYGFHFLYKLPN